MSRTSSSISSVLFNALYNFLLGFILIGLVIGWLFQKRLKNRDFAYFKARFGKGLPYFLKGDRVIWVHAPSLGEVRGATLFIRRLKEENLESKVILSTTTQAGLLEGQKNLSQLDAHFLIPLDFSFLIKRCVKKLNPKRLILIEGDLWYQLIQAVSSTGGKVFLVNGKISEKSKKRYSCVPFFTRKLFSHISHFCLQSARYQERFESLKIPPEKMTVTGNLKFDLSFPKLTEDEKRALKTRLKLSDQDQILVIGSTHSPEEAELLEKLSPLLQTLPHLKILLVPRRSARFEEVFSWLQKQGYPVGRYSQTLQGDERVILIDAMGILTQCYQLGSVAIVAGSFSSKIGGHNILEPVLLGIPVLFGPSMHTQLDLQELVFGSGAGMQGEGEVLCAQVLELFQDKQKWETCHRACLQLAKQIQGSSERTLNIVNI